MQSMRGERAPRPRAAVIPVLVVCFGLMVAAGCEEQIADVEAVSEIVSGKKAFDQFHEIDERIDNLRDRREQQIRDVLHGTDESDE